MPIALGAITHGQVQSIYQQLHNYPVGNTGKAHAPECKGAKYNIQPVRREFLSGIDAYVCLRSCPAFERRVLDGLRDGTRIPGEAEPRYGIPFLGDNSFMVDTIRTEDSAEEPAFWYRKLGRHDIEPGTRRCRLTVWLDRADMSRTVAHVFAPLQEPQPDPPEEAWVQLPPDEIDA